MKKYIYNYYVIIVMQHAYSEVQIMTNNYMISNN